MPVALAALVLHGCAAGPGPSADPTPPSDPGPRIVQPGAPGEETREWRDGGLASVEGAAWTEADVAFMQGMIHHHAQALEMTALIDERTTSEAIRQMGLRMEISQGDEIALMERWLRTRDQAVPEWRSMSTLPAADPGSNHGAAHHPAAHDGAPTGHAGHDGAGMALHDMPGMLSAEQMRALRAARGRDFDRLFLEFMIQHHEGALVMVRDLFRAPGAGQESRVFHFASEVDADQTIEIRRMRRLLATLE
jgi:uncharacterized protein (DUF305 family)